MAKRGKKLDLETKGDIIKLSKEGYGPRYIARHLELHKSTVRRYIELDLEEKVMASHSFQKHSDDTSLALKELATNKRSELLHDAFMHFKQEFPEFSHLNSWQDISKEDIKKGILEKMELLANSRSFRFCAKCAICQNIERRLRESSRGVVQLFTNSPS